MHTMIKNAIQKEEPSTTGFISEPQVLARVSVCRRTWYNWRKNGFVPYVKLGRRILYHWPSVEAAILRRQKGVAYEA